MTIVRYALMSNIVCFSLIRLILMAWFLIILDLKAYVATFVSDNASWKKFHMS